MDEKTKQPKKIDFKYNLKEYVNISFSHKRIVWPLLIGVILANIITLGDKFIFKSFIDSSTSFAAKDILLESFMVSLSIILISYLVWVACRSLLELFNFHLVNKYETAINLDLKLKYFSHIIKLDHSFHSTHKTGSLISRLNRASGAMENFTDTVLFAVSPLFIQLFILIPVFFQFGLWQALILFLTCLAYTGYSFWLSTGLQRDVKVENEFLDKEKGFIADVFTNIESVRLFGKENFIIKKFSKIIEETREKQYKAGGWWKWMLSGQIIILGTGTIFLFWISAKQFIAGDLSLGELTFIYTAYLSILGPLNWFNHGLRNISRSLTDMQDLFEYGKISKEIKDKPNAKKLEIKKGSVNFEGITFGYNKRKLFQNFNLKILPNEKVAFVGHSGCGKTSLVKLLYRMYDVPQGRITIDGEDIRDVKQESLRGEMAIVPQEPILFDDTIYNNILFARPTATREEVLAAIKFAQLDKTVKDFPLKENTIVGERGVKLSGGEKQRVSIARAILADRKILILDEATSALDSQTEHDIQEDLAKLMKGRTSIIIAHRLSTIMHADKIVVLEKGQIVQMGTHNQLISQKGKYKELWNLQKGGYIHE